MNNISLNIVKGFIGKTLFDLKKSEEGGVVDGRYVDNPHNRKLGIVGQPYVKDKVAFVKQNTKGVNQTYYKNFNPEKTKVKRGIVRDEIPTENAVKLPQEIRAKIAFNLNNINLVSPVPIYNKQGMGKFRTKEQIKENDSTYWNSFKVTKDQTPLEGLTKTIGAMNKAEELYSEYHKIYSSFGKPPERSSQSWFTWIKAKKNLDLLLPIIKNWGEVKEEVFTLRKRLATADNKNSDLVTSLNEAKKNLESLEDKKWFEGLDEDNKRAYAMGYMKSPSGKTSSTSSMSKNNQSGRNNWTGD